MNDKQLISEAMRLLGKRTSKRKAKSSAVNAEKARAKRMAKYPASVKEAPENKK